VPPNKEFNYLVMLFMERQLLIYFLQKKKKKVREGYDHMGNT
jgi:hypothetical protein